MHIMNLMILFFIDYILDLQNADKLDKDKKKDLDDYKSFVHILFEQTKMFASKDQNFYDKLICDYLHILNAGYTLDQNPSNYFYNHKKNEIGFLDLQKGNSVINIKHYIMEPLISCPLPNFLLFQDKKYFESLWQTIDEKLYIAAAKKGIDYIYKPVKHYDMAV